MIILSIYSFQKQTNFEAIEEDRYEKSFTDSKLYNVKGIDDSRMKVQHLISLHANLIEIFRYVNM